MEILVHFGLRVFKTTIQLKENIGFFWKQTLSFYKVRLTILLSSFYELTNLIVDTFSKLLVFSGNH